LGATRVGQRQKSTARSRYRRLTPLGGHLAQRQAIHRCDERIVRPARQVAFDDERRNAVRRTPNDDIQAITRSSNEQAAAVQIVQGLDELDVGAGRLRTHVGLRADRTEDEPEEIRLIDGECYVRTTQTREARTSRIIRVTRMRREDPRHALVQGRKPALTDCHEE